MLGGLCFLAYEKRSFVFWEFSEKRRKNKPPGLVGEILGLFNCVKCYDTSKSPAFKTLQGYGTHYRQYSIINSTHYTEWTIQQVVTYK